MSHMSTMQRKEREKEERRSAVIDAAERLFFSKGYDEITMDEIAKEAELAKGTLYLYFKNKDSLYTAVIVRGIEVLNRMMQAAVDGKKTGLEKTYSTGVAYYEFYKRYPGYFNMLNDVQTWGLKDIGEDVSRDMMCRNMETNRIMTDAIREGIADGTIRPDAEPGKTAMFLAYTTWVMIKMPYGGPGKAESPATRDEVVEFTLDMLGHAIENR
jgi:TetR/AcrR family transcriptional regulator